MQKTLVFGALALMLALPTALTAPAEVAVANINAPYGTDHLLVGIDESNASCGGTAPAETSCGTGLHLRAGAGTFGPGTGDGCPTACNTALPGYTGTLHSRIVYKVYSLGTQVPSTDRERTWTCNFNAGTWIPPCVLAGVDPPPSYPGQAGAISTSLGTGYITAYEHDCQSFNLGTRTPGGSGPWSCFAWHGLFNP